MSLEAEALLKQLADGHTRGSFAQACDGSDRAPANELEFLNLARWVGTCWGSSFYTITEKGLIDANPS